GTMHIATAVGTPIIGLFFAHAHPFETGPYSSGNLIFQARISCAPCSYGVECTNIVCIHKVRPDHLLSMIKIHQEEKQWRLPESMLGLEEVNIYNTCIGKDRRLRLRPLVKHPLDLNDIFREIYTGHWLESLGTLNIHGSSTSNIEEILLGEYDCKNAHKLLTRIEEKLHMLRRLEKITHQGISSADEIAQICIAERPKKINRVKILAQIIESLDKEISQIGYTHPELKPVTDLFGKRKENFQG
ncbi:uncharacterized protein METZ01_LOCUS477970, partial [marine metagenome]